MPNTVETAARWTEFLAGRPEFPRGERLAAAFNAGEITRLCSCGCNAFDLKVPEGAEVERIATVGGCGSVFEMSFQATGDGPPDRQGSLEFIVFADERGHFAGIEVDFCGNSFPVPEALQVDNTPYYVRVSSAVDA